MKDIYIALGKVTSTFQRAVIEILSEMVNDCMEVFMDDFTPYGNNFDESLSDLEIIQECCEQTHLSLSTEKCHMMMSKGIVLRNFISVAGIQVDLAKIKVIVNIPTPGL